MKTKKPVYTVYLHATHDYMSRGHGTGKKVVQKHFRALIDAMRWVSKIVETARKEKRPWEYYQIFKSCTYNTECIIFAPVAKWYYDVIEHKYLIG